jgi:hypothetical protein
MPLTKSLASIIDLGGHLGNWHQEEASPPIDSNDCFKFASCLNDHQRYPLRSHDSFFTNDILLPPVTNGSMRPMPKSSMPRATSSSWASLTRIIMHGLVSCVASCRMWMIYLSTSTWSPRRSASTIARSTWRQAADLQPSRRWMRASPRLEGSRYE